MKRAKLCSLSQIARVIEVSEQTVKNWIIWFERTGGKTGKELPSPIWVQAGSRKRRYYNERDIKVFKEFKAKKLTRWGLMAKFNAGRNWGKYGKDLLEREKRGLKYARTKKDDRNVG